MAFLALYGGIGTPRGDYSGKVEQVAPEVEETTGGDYLPPRRKKKLLKHPYEDRDRIQAAIDATLEAAAAKAFGETPEKADRVTAAVQRVRETIAAEPIDAAIEATGFPVDAAVELAILSRLEAAIQDIRQRDDEAIICLLLVA